MGTPKSVIFNGVTFRLMSSGRYYLSMSTTNEGRRRAKGLHVAVWEHDHGCTVPAGHEIHHKDGDPLNNDPGNLECLSVEQHRAIPRTIRDPEKQNAHLARIRPLASMWHASEDGRAWHRENAKRSWSQKEPKAFLCSECGVEFFAFRSDAITCSTRCQQRRRQRTNKRPVVTRKCDCCGAEFETTIPRHADRVAKTCSRSCRSKLRSVSAGL